MFRSNRRSFVDYNNCSFNNIDSVVGSVLCTRCGACYGVCPQGSINWNEDLFPYTTDKCTNCGLCLKVCGGIEVDFPKYTKKIYSTPQSLTSNAIGPVLYSEAAYSVNKTIRSKSSSGGLVSQILVSLLEWNMIDGAVVVGFSEKNPLEPEARIARSYDDVIQCSQSKYSLFPVCHIYEEIIKTPRRYAVVGLPCQIHSLFRWQEISEELGERVVLVIGLFCHMNLEPAAIYDILNIKKIRKDDIERLEYRGGKWPGGIRVTLKDGSIIPLHKGNIKDGAFNYLNKLYVAERCLLCTDFSAELSDISISDPWIRDENGRYLLEGGWSLAHIRTVRGDNVFTRLKASKSIVSKRIDASLVIKSNRSMTNHKKRGAFIRINRLIKKGRPYPEYFLKPPQLVFSDYIREILFQMSLVGWHLKKLRKPLLRIAFSAAGGFIGYIKEIVQRWRHRSI